MLLQNDTMPLVTEPTHKVSPESPNKEGVDPGKRIIAKKGRDYLVFRMEDIAYFYVDNGVSYLVGKTSSYKYITDKPLRNIESTINSPSFFRVSKKYLIHINAVVKFRPTKKGKLELLLNPDPREPIIISQLKAPLFKKWLLQN